MLNFVCTNVAEGGPVVVSLRASTEHRPQLENLIGPACAGGEQGGL